MFDLNHAANQDTIMIRLVTSIQKQTIELNVDVFFKIVRISHVASLLLFQRMLLSMMKEIVLIWILLILIAIIREISKLATTFFRYLFLAKAVRGQC